MDLRLENPFTSAVNMTTNESIILYPGTTLNLSYHDNVLFDLTTILRTTDFPENVTFGDSRHSGIRRRLPRLPQSPKERLVENIDSVVMPASLTVGILANILLVLVFMCTPLKASALSHYLTALGISDLIYLLSCLIVWISGRGVRFYTTMGGCQVTMFALLLSRFLATWYLLAAHAERFVVHFGSCRARKWCSTFRTKCIIIAIFVFSMVGFLHYIWIHIVVESHGKSQCMMMPESWEYIVQLRKIEIISAQFLPMLLIVLIDVAICVSVVSKYGHRLFTRRSASKKEMQTEDEKRGAYTLANGGLARSPSTRSGDSTPPHPDFDISREKFRATVLVVVAGMVFICLVLPSSIYRAKGSFSTLPRPSRDDIITMQLFEEIVKFNSVYKIFWYLIALRSFRHGFWHFFKFSFRRQSTDDSLQETTV